MKKTIPFLLAVLMLLSACGAQKAAPAKTPAPEQPPQAQAPQQTVPAAAPPAAASEQAAPVKPDPLAVYAPVFDSYEKLFAVVDAYRQGSDSPVDLADLDYDLESSLSLANTTSTLDENSWQFLAYFIKKNIDVPACI